MSHRQSCPQDRPRNQTRTASRRGRERLVIAVIGAVAFLLVAAGCGGDGDSASTTSPSSTPIAQDAACTLVTVADAAALFGAEATPTAADQPEGVVSQCIYESAVPADGQLLQFRIFDGTSYYSRDLAEGATPLEGLGNEAYLDAEGPSGIVDLQFTEDGYVYAFAYSNSSGDAAAKAPALEALARGLRSEG